MATGPREWSPKKKVEALDALPREMVGDGKRPNVFFVTDEGHIALISLDFEISYLFWKTLAARRPLIESALEDRLTGVIASVEPESDEPGARLMVWDNSGR